MRDAPLVTQQLHFAVVLRGRGAYHHGAIADAVTNRCQIVLMIGSWTAASLVAQAKTTAAAVRSWSDVPVDRVAQPAQFRFSSTWTWPPAVPAWMLHGMGSPTQYSSRGVFSDSGGSSIAWSEISSMKKKAVRANSASGTAIHV